MIFCHFFQESIINKIQESGFTIAMSKEMHLTKEQAEEFYSEHKDTEYFEQLVNNMIRYKIITWGILHHEMFVSSFVNILSLWMIYLLCSHHYHLSSHNEAHKAITVIVQYFSTGSVGLMTLPWKKQPVTETRSNSAVLYNSVNYKQKYTGPKMVRQLNHLYTKRLG